MRWLKPDSLFTPSPALPEERHWAEISVQKGRLLEFLVVGFGGSALPHLGCGRATTKLPRWLATSRLRLCCGERERERAPGTQRSAETTRVGARRSGTRVAASLIFLAHHDWSAPWCPEVSLFDATPRVVRWLPLWYQLRWLKRRAATPIAGGV